MGDVATDIPLAEADDSRTVTFAWTIEDVREYAQKVHGPFFTWQNGAFLTGLPMAFVAMLVVSRFAAPWIVAPTLYLTLSAFLGVAVFAGWLALVYHRIEHARTIKDPRKVGFTWVRIDPYGVTTATDVSSDFLSWFGVKKVEVFAKGVFFRSGPVHGVYVPRSAFEMDDMFDDFCEQIRRYREQKRTPPHLGPNDPASADEPVRLN